MERLNKNEGLNKSISEVKGKIAVLEAKVDSLHGSAKAVVLKRVESLTAQYHALMKTLCDDLGIGYFPRIG